VVSRGDLRTRLASATRLAEEWHARDPRPDVESFLREHEDVRDLLEPMLLSDVRTRDIADTPTGIPGPVEGGLPDPERIGRYRVLQVLGRGGFGVVYLARQEQPVQRRVALKVLKLGMDTQEVLARFASERQVLASMNHPSIAQVYDAGSTEDGRPYIAMEYVPGPNVTEYCDEHRLAIDDRLEIFAHICDAIQHAHHRGVIHRDIKPSNILVFDDDGRPTPKVIDFGVAKAMTRSLDGTRTRTGQLVGTPEYASPEQLTPMPLDIDTRSDVFSLGILLYELLVGERPFQRESILRAMNEGNAHRVAEETLVRPSTRLSTRSTDTRSIAERRQIEPSRLVRRLRGDLDWIVLRALESDRTRRYESCAQLAADVRRHLNHEPVSASAGSALYVMRKFLRRNRRLAGIAATSLAIAAVIAGLWVARRVESLRAYEALVARAESRAEEGAWGMAIQLLARAEEHRPGDVLVQERMERYEARRTEAVQERQRARLREKAVERVDKALQLLEEHRDLRRETRAMELELMSLENRSLDYGPPEQKRPMISMRREIEERDFELDQIWMSALNELYAALHLGGVDFDEGPAALARAWSYRLGIAQEEADAELAKLCEREIRSWDRRGDFVARLEAPARVSLRSDPSGAEVWISEFVDREGRLVPRAPRMSSDGGRGLAGETGVVSNEVFVGSTPIDGIELPAGSYRIVLRADGYRETVYPLALAAGQTFAVAEPVRLWLPEEYPDGEWIWIPGGESIVGGDPHAERSWPVHRAHVPGFFVGRFEVTAGAYLEFLHDQETLAEIFPDGSSRDGGSSFPDGVRPYVPRPGGPWEFNHRRRRFACPQPPMEPVVGVSWDDAQGFIAWKNRREEERGGRFVYSLPTELQWERAARGADARVFPWGNGFDWTWTKGGFSRGHSATREPVGRFHVDESPFGVRDMAGSALEWCRDSIGVSFRAVRGGAWGGLDEPIFRVAKRHFDLPKETFGAQGFRLAAARAGE